MLVSVCFGCGAESTTTQQTEAVETSTTEESTSDKTTEPIPIETSEETVELTQEETTDPEKDVTTETETFLESIEEIETTTEPIPEPKAEYTYTDMSATMYVTQTVNVRNLPTTDGKKIGSLSTNQEIAVKGQCNETEWFMFDYEGQTAFVSNKYLSLEKVEVVPPAQEVSNVPRAGDYSGGVWHNMGDYSFYIGDWTCPSGATGVAIHLNDGSAKWAWINYSDPQNVALNAFIRENQCNCGEVTHGGIKPIWDEATKSYYFP